MSLGQLTLLQVDSHARTYRWPAAARAWLESGLDCGMSSIALLTAFGRDGLSSKTCPTFYELTEEGTLPQSFQGWQEAGICRPGECLTLSLGEFPNNAAAYSLSDAIEPEAPRKYYLTAKRAASFLKENPPQLLKELLTAVVDMAGQKHKGTS